MVAKDRPTNGRKALRHPLTSRSVNTAGPIGFRHEKGKPIIVDIDFHGDTEPRYPHEVIEPLKQDESDYFIDRSLNGGFHVCLPYSDFENPTNSGSPSFFYRGYDGELRFNRCATIVTDWVGFLDWYEHATEPPSSDFYAALLRHRPPKPSRYHNPLLKELWPALVLRKGNSVIGALVKKWRREGRSEDLIQITLKKTKRRYRALLKAAREWIDSNWENHGWAAMRGFGRELLAMILLLGEKEALSYASRAALANGVDCCVATISRWRRQWKERGIIIPQGYNVIQTYGNTVGRIAFQSLLFLALSKLSQSSICS